MTEKDVFFKQEIMVFGGLGANQEIGQGEYEYPFKWQLPGSVPSSFVGKDGKSNNNKHCV